MKTESLQWGGRGRPSAPWGPILTTLMTCACWAGGAAAQDSPTPPQTIGGFTPQLPVVGVRPDQQPAVVAPFIESLGVNESYFEVKVGQGRLLTLKEPLAEAGRPDPVIAVGDPSVIDTITLGNRQIRIIGRRIGTTDLSITTSAGRTYGFEVVVVADFDVLRAQLKQVFPDATLRLAQVRDHMVVEGQARDHAQVARIVEMIQAYLDSLYNQQLTEIRATRTTGAPTGVSEPPPGVPPTPEAPAAPGQPPTVPGANVAPNLQGGSQSVEFTVTRPKVINLIRVPSTQQVLLKVRVAELNRTAFREIGADFLASVPEFETIFGSRIGGAQTAATATATGAGLAGAASNALGLNSTAFGIFSGANFDIILAALRRNNILRILAEPNLVALSGHQATFLAGGEFPITVPQSGGAGGNLTVTVQFREFGVRLLFLPYVLDNDVIRLTVDPEVSSLDFALAVTLVPGGQPIPGLNSRKAHTTVEMRQGQTLAIAGLLQLTMNGQTTRIPGLGDLPYIGPFFSNTTNQRVEKELVVTVTPYLVEPMNADQVPPGPGDEVKEPNDLEHYFLNRIEGRTGVDHRSTVKYDDPLHVVRRKLLERKYLIGPSGYSR